MSSSSTEFHKIWIEQCAATEDIREQFGTKNALDYLIGEKLFTFVMAAEHDLSLLASCQHSSPPSGGCFPLKKSAPISTTWSARSSWLHPSRRSRWKMTRRKKWTTNPGQTTPYWVHRNFYVSPVSASCCSPSD